MGLQETKIESLPFVTAELNYLAPVSGKPRTYAFDPPPGEPQSTNLPEPHHVPIFDGRAIANTFSLDREGFALVRHPTAVKDFYDEAQIKSIYYPAAEAFLRATLKADHSTPSWMVVGTSPGCAACWSVFCRITNRPGDSKSNRISLGSDIELLF